MRKKELEEKIKLLEERLYIFSDRFVKSIRENEELIDKLTEKVNMQEKMLKEQEVFLKETVCPFIADKLAEDLGDHLKGLGDMLADLFTEEPKKAKVEKKTKKAKKECK